MTMYAEELTKFAGEGADPQDIFTEGCEAAVKAVDEFVAKHGEPMYCGFGSITIYPARGKLVSFLKKNEIGRTGYQGGYRIGYSQIMGNHSKRYTQSLDIQETAVDAFANVLQSYGIKAYGEGRAD